MDLFLTGLLIRGLIVLAMFCLLVIAGALLARREKCRASKIAADTPGFRGGDPAAMDAPRATVRIAGSSRPTIPGPPHR